MIVVDSNVIAYCWINGPLTPLAQRVRRIDPDWHAPLLWRSEMRNILLGYIRDGSLTRLQAARISARSEAALNDREHLPIAESVIDVAMGSHLSAYDSEFATLALTLGVPLVTADRAVLKAFPADAMSMETFVRGRLS